jgi:hypothetical protein
MNSGPYRVQGYEMCNKSVEAKLSWRCSEAYSRQGRARLGGGGTGQGNDDDDDDDDIR